jgi:prepilin-type N-terminal cleavage/methylation domain-containing protein/prepilin-type processing-associated H-X9-DG protein
MTIVRRSRSRLSRASFTLIELLVVVGIIALLASLLFPAMGKARLRAERTASSNNLRNIHQSMIAYANDNDLRMPRTSTQQRATIWPTGRNGDRHLARKLAPYMGVQVADDTVNPVFADGPWLKMIGYRGSSGVSVYDYLEQLQADGQDPFRYITHQWEHEPTPGVTWTHFPWANYSVSNQYYFIEHTREFANVWALGDIDERVNVSGYNHPLDDPMWGNVRNVLFFDGSVRQTSERLDYDEIP